MTSVASNIRLAKGFSGRALCHLHRSAISAARFPARDHDLAHDLFVPLKFCSQDQEHDHEHEQEEERAVATISITRRLCEPCSQQTDVAAGVTPPNRPYYRTRSARNSSKSNGFVR